MKPTIVRMIFYKSKPYLFTGAYSVGEAWDHLFNVFTGTRASYTSDEIIKNWIKQQKKLGYRCIKVELRKVER